jgi:hypothetical protein
MKTKTDKPRCIGCNTPNMLIDLPFASDVTIRLCCTCILRSEESDNPGLKWALEAMLLKAKPVAGTFGLEVPEHIKVGLKI